MPREQLLSPLIFLHPPPLTGGEYPCSLHVSTYAVSLLKRALHFHGMVRCSLCRTSLPSQGRGGATEDISACLQASLVLCTRQEDCLCPGHLFGKTTQAQRIPTSPNALGEAEKVTHYKARHGQHTGVPAARCALGHTQCHSYRVVW